MIDYQTEVDAIMKLIECGAKVYAGLKSENPEVREMAEIAKGLLDILDRVADGQEGV